jgi:hypothetical protein
VLEVFRQQGFKHACRIGELAPGEPHVVVNG